MKLLKEYIRLIIKEELEEDINIEYLSPRMLGVYAFAQAINKLIYEGNALPGAVPIDIIDAGVNIKSAPMTTKTERQGGMSFQYSGNSFKLYLNPTLRGPEMSSFDETHDIVHAFTANIAKAFGRRRQSVEKSGQYKISPSRFNKITIDRKVKEQINDAFEKEFGFRLPEEAFTKPFTMKSDEYSQWFMKEFQEPIIDKGLDHFGVRTIALDFHKAVTGSAFEPGLIGKKYYARYPADIERAFSFVGYLGKKRFVQDGPFGVRLGKVEYKQSAEDEEELGNKMNDNISFKVSKGLHIENPEKIADTILEEYKESVGLTGLGYDEFKHRYDTPEVKSAMIRLFQIYNTLLDRYQKAQEYYYKKQFPGVK